MSLTHAEQLSFPVLKRAASRSASSWIHCVRAVRASDWASASEVVYMSDYALCTREATRYRRLCVAVSVFIKQLRLLSAPRFHPARAPLKRALRAIAVGLAKLARKIVVEFSSQKMF